MELLLKFRQHCAAEQLAQPGDRLLLAVSGGVDSCVMLDLFCQLQDQWQLQLAVAHVNHQLRGRESDEDEIFVKALAQQAGLPFFSQRVEVPTYAAARKLSLEHAGRELRYQALENFRASWQARAIVTAHTLDDQAETILDHLMRGCGLAGLSGMSSQRKTILRPLLPFSRTQLEEYARARQLNWREDRTNADTQFRRNRIRHELLPLLRSRFNPRIAHSLQRLADIAASAENYFLAEAETRFPEIVKDQQSDKIILDLELFWKYFPILQHYVLRAVIRRLAHEQAELTFSETARMLALLQRTGKTALDNQKPAISKRYIWRNQIEVLVDHDGAVFEKQKEKGKKKKASAFIVPVTIGERCEIPGTKLALLIEPKDLPADWRQQVNSNSQFVDAEKVRGELRVRFPQRGDRFVPLRANDGAEADRGAKKLSDFFTDLKAPLHRRRTAPVLEGDHIVWICGYRIDNRCKITPATKSVLHLQLQTI